jgi:hypothetical protein
VSKDYVLQIEMVDWIRWQNWLSGWEEEYFCSQIQSSIVYDFLKGSYCLLRVQHCYIMKHIPKKSDMFRAN